MKRLLLLLFFIAVGSAQNCLSSADRLINKRCFTFVNQQLNYQDARDWCHFRNPVTFSYLATIPDTTTANFLASYARTIFNTNDGSFWIGLSRYNTSSRFQWDDGTPVSWTNFQVQNAQNYVAESITNAKFTTYPSENKYNFICSYDPNGSQTGRPSEGLDTTTVAWGTTAEPDGPTPTDDTSCTPSSLAPFLFAYSNDLDAEDVRDTWRQMVSSNYASYSSVRFDLNNNYGIEVYWNETYESADAVVQRTLPDSSLGFPSSAYGSNILLAIKKYFTESSEPVCGSIIVVLLKRYPNEADYSQVVSLARQHHAVIHVISSVLPSGGTQSIVMYGVSSKTNGMCGFEFDSEFSTFINFLPLFLTPFPVYATNIKVSGNGTTHLPPLSVPDFDNYFIMMTLQDYGPLDSFRDLQLTWYNRQSSYSNSFDMTLSVALGRDTNGTCVNTWNYLDSVNYDMTLSYTYSDWKTESLQIRVYRGTPLPYWLPYSD